MKNIQIIDGADNCTYDIYAASSEDFAMIFPNDQDVEFIDDFIARVGQQKADQICERLWRHPVNKKNTCGIQGTLFYELEFKKKYYPTKKEAEMTPGR